MLQITLRVFILHLFQIHSSFSVLRCGLSDGKLTTEVCEAELSEWSRAEQRYVGVGATHPGAATLMGQPWLLTIIWDYLEWSRSDDTCYTRCYSSSERGRSSCRWQSRRLWEIFSTLHSMTSVRVHQIRVTQEWRPGDQSRFWDVVKVQFIAKYSSTSKASFFWSFPLKCLPWSLMWLLLFYWGLIDQSKLPLVYIMSEHNSWSSPASS